MTRVTKCVSRGVAGQQKPCGFAAALGRRQRVALRLDDANASPTTPQGQHQ